MSLQFRRGLDADRTSITPLPGEPLWITDTDELYVGDGSTAGGVLITGGGGGGAPTNATYITQTSNGTLTNEQALASLATGILKNTTTTGVLSIAVGADLPSHTHTLADITDDGTMAAQNANNVAITGGSLAGVTVTTGTYSSNVNEAVMHAVRKETAGTITKGQVIRITNSSGTHLQVELADASVEATSAGTIGIAATSITNSTTGYMMVMGELTGLSNVPTASFTNGAALWLSETTGEFTTTRPTQPAHGVFLGWVVEANNGSAGRIYIKVINYQELNELHDVLISGVADNHFLVYDNATSLWKNEAPATARTSLGLGTAATSNTGDFAASSHTHGNVTNDGKIGSTSGLPIKTGTAGVLEAGAFGTSAGQFAEGNHAHGNVTSGGAIGSTPGLVVKTGTSGALTTLALGTAGQVLKVNSGATDIEWGTDNTGGGGGSVATDTIWDAAGDLAVGSGADTAVKLGRGSAGQVLTVNSGGTDIEWATPAAGSGTKTYAFFTPLDAQPPASNFATLDTRNSIAVLEFDGGSTDEATTFVGIMPEAASLGSGLKVRIHWMADTATSGDVRWGVAFERMNTDLTSDSFDTVAEGNGTANGTSGIPTVTEITITTIDSIVAGDAYRLKVYREASDTTNDTMSGDAQLIAVEVRSAA